MISGSLKFEGGKELMQALEQLPLRTSNRFVREALVEAAEPMRDRMEALAPVSDEAPHLKNVIVISKARTEDAREMAVAVGPTKKGFYGSFQELGTAHHGPQPFARPAFDQTWLQSLALLGSILWRELASRGIRRATTVVDGPIGGEEV